MIDIDYLLTIAHLMDGIYLTEFKREQSVLKVDVLDIVASQLGQSISKIPGALGIQWLVPIPNMSQGMTAFTWCFPGSACLV